MAQIISSIIFGPSNLEVSSGGDVELIGPVYDGFKAFNAIYTLGNQRIMGIISSQNLSFTQDEINKFELLLDSNGLPLFCGLQVKYIGTSNEDISQNDILIVKDVWYSQRQVECSHTSNAPPNTDGRVVVPCNLIERF